MKMRPIVTAAQMRAAEAEVIESGTSVETLMERAGVAAAEAIWRFAGPLPALILCGPGNNGGDGYVIARTLRARGVKVRIAALGDPVSAAGGWARSGWDGPVERLDEACPAPLLVDALFGTGLSRPLDPTVTEALLRLAEGARASIAIDLPSGAASDDGALLSNVPDYAMTICLGALKPSHLLQPAARNMGRLVVADIGVTVQSDLQLLGPPSLRRPGPDDHKYSRGYVAVAAGEMPRASALSAAAAQRAGAGYVRIFGAATFQDLPKAVVQGGAASMDDERIGALVIGPGLGRGPAASALLEQAFEAGRAMIVDADALVLLAGNPAGLTGQAESAILTPHAGEFSKLFGSLPGSKVEQARAAAARSGAVVVYKGPDTVIAAPTGQAAIAPPAPAWLASAGTGDVLSGVIAAMRAGGMGAFDAACAGVWLHRRAAERAGPALIADDLIEQLSGAVVECL